MKRPLLLAALAAAVALGPVAVAAQSMSGSGSMTGMHATMMHPSTIWMCHATTRTETPTAMTADGKQHLTCKTVDMTKLMTGPSISSAMSADDANKAWKDFLERQVSGQY